MKALVTGATGFIGANIVRVLLKKGYEVQALVRRNSDQRNLDGGIWGQANNVSFRETGSFFLLSSKKFCAFGLGGLNDRN